MFGKLGSVVESARNMFSFGGKSNNAPDTGLSSKVDPRGSIRNSLTAAMSDDKALDDWALGKGWKGSNNKLTNVRFEMPNDDVRPELDVFRKQAKTYGMFALSLETAEPELAETARPYFNAGIHGDRIHWEANDNIESPSSNVLPLRRIPSPQEVRKISPAMRPSEGFVRESPWAHRMRFAVAAAVLACIGGLAHSKPAEAAKSRSYSIENIVPLTNQQAAQINAGNAQRSDFDSNKVSQVDVAQL